MKNPAACKHEQFRALVKVQTIIDDSGSGYDQITTLECAQCKTAFADAAGNTEQHARVYPVLAVRRRPVLEVVQGALLGDQRVDGAAATRRRAQSEHTNTPEHPGEKPAA